MRRLSLRLRLTLVFALVMALVLLAMSAFVFTRVHAELTHAVDQDLRGQLTEARRHAGEVDPDSPAIAQILDAQGNVLRGSAIAMISSDQLAQVVQGHTILTDATLSGRKGRWRVLAEPATGGGAVAVAEPLHPTDEALGHLL
ncbi:MAG TPA: hypothetical protein VLN26_12615, partial [Gaiellaceae bacterium]|nr:hypothetical protein [Gaiellaceae bacterium]